MKPARLEKRKELTGMDMFMSRYGHIIVFFLVVMLMIMLAVLFVTVIDMASAGNLTMTESNQYYYHLKDVV